MGESAVWSLSGLRVIPAVVVVMGLWVVVVAVTAVVIVMGLGMVVVAPSVVVVMPTAVSVGERRTAYG